MRSLSTGHLRASLRCNFSAFKPVLPVILAVGAFLAVTASRAEPAGEKVFMVGNTSHTLEDFRIQADLATRLKPYGRVQLVISALADKDWSQIPEGGSPWHEYACYVPAPWMFYPHPEIAPHMPADWVMVNRKLLLAKAELVRELGFEAIFQGKNSHILPESFFQEHPHLRGPRCDHPRRSTEEAFSMCVDLPESREMIEWMMAELKRNVPGITAVITGTNDAGAGLCWAAALYPGPNGPRHCINRNAGVRVRDLSKAVHRGAVKGGGDIILHWGNVNFWQNELEVVRPLLPPDTYIDRYDPAHVSVGTRINSNYPFLGIIDPLAVFSTMERYHDPATRELSIGYSAMYSRAQDTPETVAKLLDVVEGCINEPTGNFSERLEKLKKFAALWGGEKNREKVFEAFYNMHQAFKLKDMVTPGYGGYSNFYCGVSMRHLTRPLLIKPELLAPGEEACFLPHVFNPSKDEARMDYIDFHGSRMQGTPSWDFGGLRRALSLANRAGRSLENLEGAPEGAWLERVGRSLRMWASEVRSIHNFYHAQLIRDKYADILAGEPRVHAKVETWEGDPGNLEWYGILRDELDNTNELIAMLEDGGIELVARAKDPRYEDTFLLGPDLIAQLRNKARIMREHWLDAQKYLAPPHK